MEVALTLKFVRRRLEILVLGQQEDKAARLAGVVRVDIKVIGCASPLVDGTVELVSHWEVTVILVNRDDEVGKLVRAVEIDWAARQVAFVHSFPVVLVVAKSRRHSWCRSALFIVLFVASRW